MAYITVRVVGHDGRPRSQVKVQIAKDGLLGGMSSIVYTDSEGEAEIHWEAGSPIAIFVNGAKARSNQAVKAHFAIEV